MFDNILKYIDDTDDIAIEGLGDIMKSIGGGIKWAGGKLVDLVRKFFSWIGKLFENIIKLFKRAISNARSNLMTKEQREASYKKTQEEIDIERYTESYVRALNLFKDIDKYGIIDNNVVGKTEMRFEKLTITKLYDDFFINTSIDMHNLSINGLTENINTFKKMVESIPDNIEYIVRQEYVVFNTRNEITAKILETSKRLLADVEKCKAENNELKAELESVAKILDSVSSIEDPELRQYVIESKIAHGIGSIKTLYDFVYLGASISKEVYDDSVLLKLQNEVTHILNNIQRYNTSCLNLCTKFSELVSLKL